MTIEQTSTTEVENQQDLPSEEDIYNLLDDGKQSEEGSKATADVTGSDGTQDKGEGQEKQPQQSEAATGDGNKKDNNSDTNCPEKFLSDDGTPDTNKILQSYAELEKYHTSKIQELTNKISALENQQVQEKMQQAQMQGYTSPEDMEIVARVAQSVADGYSRYISYVEDPQYVRNLLLAYSKEPSRELLAQIEEEFDVDIVKGVTANAAMYARDLKQQIEMTKAQQNDVRLREEATNYVQNAVNSYPEWFKVQEFVDFFGDALKTKGDAFEVSAFVQHIEKLREHFRNELLNELKSKESNNSALNELIRQTPNGGSQQQGGKDVTLKSSDAEITAEIDKFI